MAARLTCYPTVGKKKAGRICEAFALGCDGRVAVSDTPILHDGPAFFYGWTHYTWPLMRQCISEGREWYYADNAYYFGRPRLFRVTRGALMHDGSGQAVARANVVQPRVRPWRQDGRHIILATQSEAFYSLRMGQSRAEWTAAIVARLKQHTDRPIKACHKPDTWGGKPHPHLNFEAILPGAWSVVSHSSSVMVKALCDGVPVFSTAPSMASRMGLSDLSMIETPAYPDGREQWIANLMANQWSQDEMKSGQCWRDLQSQEPVSLDLARTLAPAVAA